MRKEFVVVVEEFGYSEFSDHVVSQWGDQSPLLGQGAGELHFQMGELANICKSDPEQAVSILAFLEEILSKHKVASEIPNAVAISFLTEAELDALGLRAHTGPRVAALLRDQSERLSRGA